MDTQIQERQKPPTRMNQKRLILRHNIMKLSKVKGKENLKSNMSKMTWVQWSSHKIISGRSFAGQGRFEWYSQSAERRNLQLRIIYQVKLSYKNERQIKTFSD